LIDREFDGHPDKEIADLVPANGLPAASLAFANVISRVDRFPLEASKRKPTVRNQRS
jgi:hypothetical protein